MSQKRYIGEIIAFCTSFLLLFVSFFLVVFFTSQSNTGEELSTDLQVAESLFVGTDAKVTGEKTVDCFKGDENSKIRVSIITRESDSDYTIVYDSQGLYESTEKADELEAVNLDKEVTRKSSYGYSMIYKAIKDKENPLYYVRVAIKESTATRLSKNFLIYGSVILSVLLTMYVFYKVNEYKKSIRPLKEQIQRLSYVAGENKESFDDGSDLFTLTESVNKVSSSLDRKITDLERERAKTQMILDSISQGFMALSGEGEIVLFNKKAGSIFGYEEKDVINKRFDVLVLNKEFQNKIELCIKTKEDNLSFDYERQGLIYKVSIMPLSYPLDDSSISGLAILLMEVTNERNLAKTKNDFFSNASHELKSPLTSIIGYLQMIEEGILSSEEDKEEAIKKTIFEAKRMKDIIADMLTINTLENKEGRNVENINARDSIKLALDGQLPPMREKKIALKAELTDYQLKADRKDLDKLFSNLISNAVKYNKEGGSIVIKMDKEKREISVSDTGIGIKEENLSRIFERFYRVDNSRGKDNVEGTGLGLAIVRHTCELYGYQIKVNSVFGQGSEFIIKTN